MVTNTNNPLGRPGEGVAGMPPDVPAPYKLEKLIGRGGFGAVYLATDVRLRRQVAIKVIDQARMDARARAALQSEARTLASLTHPHIVALYAFEETDTHAFLVMEYVAGQPLAERLAESVLSLDDTVRIVGDVAAALGFAHRQGVLHLDIKPGNILLTDDDEPKLVDFGLSQVAGGLAADAERIFGTPAFMAPELIRNEPPGPPTDLYALGVMLYLMSTGRLPFSGDTRMAMFRAHLEDTPPDPQALNPAIRPALANVIRKALEKSPRRRFQSAESFADALKKAGGGVLSGVEASADAEAPLAPDERELVQYTIAADVLAPGLSLPRNVMTEFMICGSLCRGTALVKLTSYSRERLRSALTGRKVGGRSFGAAASVGEGAARHQVQVGRGITCQLSEARESGSGQVEGSCLVARMGHETVEKYLLDQGTSLRITQALDHLWVGTTFDEPPEQMHLSARQHLKGSLFRDKVISQHLFLRAHERMTLRPDAPAIPQRRAVALMEAVLQAIKKDLDLEPMPVRLGAMEVMLEAIAAHLTSVNPQGDREIDAVASRFIEEEGAERWKRFATAAKAACLARRPKLADRLVGAIGRARHRIIETGIPEALRPTSDAFPEDAAPRKSMKRRMAARLTATLGSRRFQPFPVDKSFSPIELDLVRYPAADGFPTAYLRLYVEHILQRGDLFSGPLPLIERWRQLSLLLHLSARLARAQTMQTNSLDMTRLQIVEGVRIADGAYWFGGELSAILHADPAASALWERLHLVRPIAPVLGDYL